MPNIQIEGPTIKRKFGFRIHCGEISIPCHGQETGIFRFHMKVAVDAIRTIVDAGIPVRIGHGVAFAECIRRQSDAEYSFIDRLLEHNKKHANRRKAIAIEINPTSNNQLLLNPSGEMKQAQDTLIAPHAVGSLKQTNLHLPIAIGTDDDGILSAMKGHVGPSKKVLRFDQLHTNFGCYKIS